MAALVAFPEGPEPLIVQDQHWACDGACDWGKRVEELASWNPGFCLREFYKTFGLRRDLVLHLSPDDLTYDEDYKDLLLGKPILFLTHDHPPEIQRFQTWADLEHEHARATVPRPVAYFRRLGPTTSFPMRHPNQLIPHQVVAEAFETKILHGHGPFPGPTIPKEISSVIVDTKLAEVTWNEHGVPDWVPRFYLHNTPPSFLDDAYIEPNIRETPFCRVCFTRYVICARDDIHCPCLPDSEEGH